MISYKGKNNTVEANDIKNLKTRNAMIKIDEYVIYLMKYNYR